MIIKTVIRKFPIYLSGFIAGACLIVSLMSADQTDLSSSLLKFFSILFLIVASWGVTIMKDKDRKNKNI